MAYACSEVHLTHPADVRCVMHLMDVLFVVSAMYVIHVMFAVHKVCGTSRPYAFLCKARIVHVVRVCVCVNVLTPCTVHILYIACLQVV